MMISVAFLLLAVSTKEATATTEDAKFYADANAATISAIYSIQATCTRERIPKGDTKAAPEKVFEVQWQMGQPEGIERLKTKDLLLLKSPGLPQGIRDVLVEQGSKYKMLQNWDPENPQPLGPIQQGSCSGEIGLMKGVFPGLFNGRGPLLWLIQVAPVVRDLRQAVRVSPAVSVKEHVNVAGSDCVVISLDTPVTEPQKWHYDIYLDRAKGYLIRRGVSSMSNVHVVGRNDPINVVDTTEVLEFQEPKPGIYIPRRVRIERSDSDFIATYRFENVVVNEPPPPDAGKFTFPEWCVVANFMSNKTEIMGKNNTVVASFSKPGERNRWLAKYAPDGNPTERQAWTRIAALVALNLIVLFAVVAYGIRRRLKLNAATPRTR